MASRPAPFIVVAGGLTVGAVRAGYEFGAGDVTRHDGAR